MFVLTLNDMRAWKIEIPTHIAVSETRHELEELMRRETVELYTDVVDGRRWAKTFRKGGPLEWYNSPGPEQAPGRGDSFGLGIIQIPTLDDHIAQAVSHARRNWEQAFSRLPQAKDLK